MKGYYYFTPGFADMMANGIASARINNQEVPGDYP